MDPRRPDIRHDYRECRRVARSHARSFYFASHVLPRRKRMAAYAVYAFCRHADNAVDEASPNGDPEALRSSLQHLREELGVAFQPPPAVSPRLPALQDTVRRYAIPKGYFDDLLRGVEMDTRRNRFETFEELREYCYYVASVVGLIMTEIFGSSDRRALEHAVDLGIAMQLTNILRDVGEDIRKGRLYLPAREMRQCGCSEEDLRRGLVTPPFVALMRAQIHRAREYYSRANQGIGFLTDDGSRTCVRLMSRIYEGILDAIEANRYDVFSRRAHVPFLRKVRIALNPGERITNGNPTAR